MLKPRWLVLLAVLSRTVQVFVFQPSRSAMRREATPSPPPSSWWKGRLRQPWTPARPTWCTSLCRRQRAWRWLRLLSPQPKERLRTPPGLDLGITSAIWSGLASRTVENGIEFKRADGRLAVARPNENQFVGQLWRGTLDHLKIGRLWLFGVGEKVTGIVVDVPPPTAPEH